MRIAQLSSNVESVPPGGYGGTELVLNLLSEELVARGHEVTLFATGDSQTSGRLVSVVDKPLRTAPDIPVRRWQAYDIQLLLKLRQMRDQFDVVHNHMGWQALPYLDALGLPVVSTNHNPIKKYCAPIYLAYKHLPYVAISDAYRRLNYGDQLNYVATVYNGIDVSRFTDDEAETDKAYLLFIGRLCEDKGTAPAIEIAKRLKLPIKLAGKVDDADVQYFEKNVKPHLAGREVEYVGEVNHQQKLKLYQGAIATVYPIAFEEPFGLVMAESLAAGTPVLALDRGSVREVLSDGETAIIGNSIEELVSRFERLKEIRSENCTRRVNKLFSKERMVDSYVDVYNKLVGGNR
jgi:glycosyltransferase involved in cell wall biosynthesis